MLLSEETEFSLVALCTTYPSSLPLVPSNTSTLCWSGKLQFTLDSLVLPVWRVESYTLTLPTYSPTRWCARREGERGHILFNQANLALQCESAAPNRACKISCVMHVSVWWAASHCVSIRDGSLNHFHWYVTESNQSVQKRAKTWIYLNCA